MSDIRVKYTGHESGGAVINTSPFLIGRVHNARSIALYLQKIVVFHLSATGGGPVIGMSIDRESTAMQVKMPCGEIHTYKRFCDIPSETTYCRCGNKDHIVIEYRDE